MPYKGLRRLVSFEISTYKPVYDGPKLSLLVPKKYHSLGPIKPRPVIGNEYPDHVNEPVRISGPVVFVLYRTSPADNALVRHLDDRRLHVTWHFRNFVVAHGFNLTFL